MNYKKLIPALLFAVLLIASCAEKNPRQAATDSFEVEYVIDLNSLDSINASKLLKNYLAEVMENKRKAYSYKDVSKTIGPEEILALATQIDTFYVESPEPPYDLKMYVSKNIFDPYQMEFLRMKEMWYLNAQGEIIGRKPIAMAPQLFKEPLCWIKLDELAAGE